MDGDKIKEVSGRYREFLKGLGVDSPGSLDQYRVHLVTTFVGIMRDHFAAGKIEPADFPYKEKPSSHGEILSHCCGMLPKMEVFLQEGRLGKSFRWVGFILGCVWSISGSSLLNKEMLSFCNVVLDRMDGLVEEGATDEAFVFLSFTQGCFWSMGKFTLEELMNHNRPGGVG